MFWEGGEHQAPKEFNYMLCRLPGNIHFIQMICD